MGDALQPTINEGDVLLSDRSHTKPRPVGRENRIPVRVRGVDTPEVRGKCASEKARARQARDYVKALLGTARQIELRDTERGKYFRLVADVEVDRQDLAATLIEAVHRGPPPGLVWGVMSLNTRELPLADGRTVVVMVSAIRRGTGYTERPQHALEARIGTVCRL